MNTREKYENIKSQIESKYPFFAGILSKAEKVMDEKWYSELVDDLELLFGDVKSEAFEKALLGYVEFSIDAAKNQEFFIRNGKYKASNFAEVKETLLDNPEHMLGNYLPGMFVSHYFWPHHYTMGRRYKDEVIPMVKEHNPKYFVEVGTGSAMYSKLTMEELPEVQGFGYDISPHSVSFGRGVAKTFGFDDRFTFIQQDAFANPPERKADYIVSQEVLEHLEDPFTFCKNLCAILSDDGCAYITAAITAAHSDHIYLFSHPDELLTMLEAAGFRSLHYVEEASVDTRVPDKTPRICGHFLVKA